MFRENERRRFEAIFADHHIVVLEQAGHYLWEDAPGEIATAIRRWWPEMERSNLDREET